jgi:hypothetical protein
MNNPITNVSPSIEEFISLMDTDQLIRMRRRFQRKDNTSMVEWLSQKIAERDREGRE